MAFRKGLKGEESALADNRGGNYTCGVQRRASGYRADSTMRSSPAARCAPGGRSASLWSRTSADTTSFTRRPGASFVLLARISGERCKMVHDGSFAADREDQKVQTVMHVTCTKGRSLRSLIGNEVQKLASCSLEVKAEKTNRNPGWMKIKGTDDGSRGALNISWNASTKTLTCRIVNRGAGKPNLILGNFVDFLLRYYGTRIRLINIFQV